MTDNHNELKTTHRPGVGEPRTAARRKLSTDHPPGDRPGRPAASCAPPSPWPRAARSGRSTNGSRRPCCSTSRSSPCARCRPANSNGSTRWSSSTTTNGWRTRRTPRRGPLRRLHRPGSHPDALVRQHRRLCRHGHDGRHVGHGRLVRPDRPPRPPLGRRRNRRRARNPCRPPP